MPGTTPEPATPPPRIAVIGAGWAGIAAAVELAENGTAVTLFEAGRVPGGRARSVAIDGRQLDNGQHILLGAYRETLTLMRRIGADPDTLFERRPLQVIDDAGFRLALPQLPAPLNVALGLLGATAVDWPEKLKTAWWMQRVKWNKFRLTRDVTVADWLDAAGQTGALRRHLWEPLCLAALNTPAERASAQLFANVLRDSLGSPRRADTDLLLPRVTLGELLPEPACRWLAGRGAELRYGQRVRELQANATGVSVDGETFSAAVLAVAPQHVGALWPEAAVDFAYEPIATVYLQFARQTALPFPLCAVHGKTGQWVVDRGQGLFGCVLSGHGDWENLDDEQLAATLAEETRPGETPSWFKVIREKRATFSSRPQQARPAWQTHHPQLVLAGDATWSDYPATLEGAVRSGLRAARALLERND